MKKVYTTFTAIFLTVLLSFGQGSLTNLPGDHSGDSQSVNHPTDKNYVITYTYRNENSPSISITGDVSPAVQYYDGLGRPTQTVLVNASPTAKDMLSLQTYDSYGRPDKSYLPYAKSSANNGNMAPDFVSEQASFLSVIYGSSDGIKGYSQTGYDGSPLNRVLIQGAPGKAWQITTGKHPVGYAYKTNTSSIQSWKYSGDIISSFYYSSGTLYVKETADEDGKVIREYTDKEGKLVQREQGTAKTRYCYDDFGLLRCVLQPLAISPESSGYCFYYKYDERKRLSDKKIPGKDWEYFIYDSRDRLVLSEDGTQRNDQSGQWIYTIYDFLNRPIEQGVWDPNQDRTTLKNHVAGSIDYITLNATTRVVQKKIHYDNYTGAYTIGPDALSLGVTQASNNKGRVTWDETKLLESEAGMDIWITATYFYDKYGRLIQTAKDNHLNGKDYITNKYNFSGQITQTRYRQTVDGVLNYIDQTSQFDHRGRLMKTNFLISGGTLTLLSANNYDEAGQLVDKYLHSQNSSSFLQRMDYEYNIRGWLTNIDNPSSFTENDKFGLQLYYNIPLTGTDSLFNGNIEGMKWGNTTFNNMSYHYSYNNMNMLTEANFDKSGFPGNAFDCGYSYDNNGNLELLTRKDYLGDNIDDLEYTYNNSSNLISSIYDFAYPKAGIINYPGTPFGDDFDYDFNANMIYEPNKNINLYYNQLNLPYEINFSLNRKINYYYTFNGEKLRQTVEDNGTVTKSDYCGPFVYETSSGVRSLKYLITPEGRAVKNGTLWDYEYNLKDHLGNVNVVIKKAYDSAFPVQTKYYYPFGLEMSDIESSSSSTNKYMYNGKEHQNSFDLGWYDYGARFYDPAIGRFHSVDPLTEKRPWESPYSYCGNNPVNRVDPTGMIWDDQKVADALKETLTNKINHLNGINTNNKELLKNENLTDDQKTDLNEKISGIEDRISEMNQSINDIDQLGSDKDNTYALNDGKNNDPSPKGDVSKGDDGKVNINAPTDGLAFHEIKHVSQSLNAGSLIFKGGRLQNAGTTPAKQGENEVKGWQAQFSFTGYKIGGKTIYTPKAITPALIGNLRDVNGKLLYPFMNQ